METTENSQKTRNMITTISNRLQKSRLRKHFIKKDTLDIITVIGISTLVIILCFLNHFKELLGQKAQIESAKVVPI
ncbi:hypothetical protein MTP99_005398 [Tenebrio molitor]|nr:hypothetical protein MTP99_005398 [Tenebrio molitor]